MFAKRRRYYFDKYMDTRVKSIEAGYYRALWIVFRELDRRFTKYG